jgi:putative transposase
MRYHVFYINLIKLTITIDKLMRIYNDCGINDLLTEDACESKMQELAVILDDKGFKKSADTIDRFRFDLWNYKSFPRSHWRRIRTTNGLERINKELKRRSRVSGAYSNDQSLLRVAVCIMMDINEDWITGKRYLSLEE